MSAASSSSAPYDSTGGVELWKSDGTASGTVRVKDIRSGTASAYPHFFTNVGGILYFIADNGVTGDALWKSDGTGVGTVLVKDIYDGSGPSPRYLTNVGGTLYFSASDSTSSYELWKSDGTSAGTVRIKDINPGVAKVSPKQLLNIGGTLYFVANDGVSGFELWKSDENLPALSASAISAPDRVVLRRESRHDERWRDAAFCCE